MNYNNLQIKSTSDNVVSKILIESRGTVSQVQKMGKGAALFFSHFVIYI